MAPTLTAGEECKAAAQALSAFTGTGSGGNCIPKNFISMAQAIAIFRGENGVAMVRLKSGDWSAPCAIILEVPHGGSVQYAQDTVLMFMSEPAVLALVSRTRLILDGTHRFEAGVYSASGSINSGIDIYGYVRFNNQFTPAPLLKNMAGWGVREDMTRHARWHGVEVTWADVLMNKITVDRSSIGNALYLVVNIAAGGNSQGVIEVNGRKNYADLDKLATRIGLDGEPPRVSVTNQGPSAEQLAAEQLKRQQESMKQLLMQQQREQQQLAMQQQQQQQMMGQQGCGMMNGGFGNGMGGGFGAAGTGIQGYMSPTMVPGQMTSPALGGVAAMPGSGYTNSPTSLRSFSGNLLSPNLQQSAMFGGAGGAGPQRSFSGNNMIPQELLIQQQQHQIDSAQFNVGTASIEEQLRRLKQQTSQIEQEQQQIQMAKQGLGGGGGGWM
ncbi:hypothetical protein HDU98_002805 [Podochytrium sp. JEL0797]|nr:hypothetical protein HDU98_002805 [Podochytrium sp. JEL0797]